MQGNRVGVFGTGDSEHVNRVVDGTYSAGFSQWRWQVCRAEAGVNKDFKAIRVFTESDEGWFNKKVIGG